MLGFRIVESPALQCSGPLLYSASRSGGTRGRALDERRHHVQSANLVLAGLQTTTAGAELLTEDSLVCVTEDTTAPIPDSSQASTRQLVLKEGHLWLMVGLVTMINLLILSWTCSMCQPICGSHPIPAEEDSAEQIDQVSNSLPGESTAPRFSVICPHPKRQLSRHTCIHAGPCLPNAVRMTTYGQRAHLFNFDYSTRDMRDTDLSVLFATPSSSKFPMMSSRRRVKRVAFHLCSPM
eukprot:296724-Amphidinium_carterae.1